MTKNDTVTAGFSFVLIIGAMLAFLLALPVKANSANTKFNSVVTQIFNQPYQPNYVPLGADAAFPGTVANDAPAEDYTDGSIPGTPNSPNWPPAFQKVVITSADGTKMFAQVAVHPGGTHAGIVVAHGFNTNAYQSVIRWAAMLYANGYNVIAADQRDFTLENSAGFGYPGPQQTFGWKESQDILAAGRYLKAQKGVSSVGLVGFSEGAQNTVLALAADGQSKNPIFSAGLAFSGPADQSSQIYSTAVPAGCSTPNCSYPATNALVTLVVPPYTFTDVCSALNSAATFYATSTFSILAHDSAFHVQPNIKVPLLNVYAADDSLVQPFNATMMAGYEAGNPTQKTLMLTRGEHAYFFDRWWQQEAILLYFKNLLPSAASDASITTTATVNQTPGGAPANTQLTSLGDPTQASANALLAPDPCDTSLGKPGAVK